MCRCALMSLCVPGVFKYPQRSEDIRSPRAVIAGTCKLPDVCWAMNESSVGLAPSCITWVAKTLYHVTLSPSPKELNHNKAQWCIFAIICRNFKKIKWKQRAEQWWSQLEQGGYGKMVNKQHNNKQNTTKTNTSAGKEKQLKTFAGMDVSMSSSAPHCIYLLQDHLVFCKYIQLHHTNVQ